MRLSKLLPVFLITLASCSVESSKDSSAYPEWEYTKIKKELAAGWNTWDTRSVFTQVWSEDKVGIRMSFVDAAGKEFDQIRIGNMDTRASGRSSPKSPTSS